MHPMHLQAFVLHSLTFYAPVAYVVMALGAALEGDAFIFTSAFLSSRGILDPFVTFAVIYASVIGGDILLYKLGAATANSPRKIFRLLHRPGPYIDRHLTKRLGKALFFTKFMYGLHHIALMRAGALRVDLKRFIRFDLIASLLWIAILGSLAFLAGDWLPFFRRSLRFTEEAFLAGLILFFLVEYMLRRLAHLIVPLVPKDNDVPAPGPEQKVL